MSPKLLEQGARFLRSWNANNPKNQLALKPDTQSLLFFTAVRRELVITWSETELSIAGSKSLQASIRREISFVRRSGVR